jgi:hypothetical protein
LEWGDRVEKWLELAEILNISASPSFLPASADKLNL